MSDLVYVVAADAGQASTIIAAYQGADDESAISMIRDKTVLTNKIDARYAARDRRNGGEVVDVFSFGADGRPSLVDHLTAEADEFLFYTPAAKAGTLYIRSLPDGVVLAVARDEHWATQEFAQLQAHMDTLTEDESGGKTNPSWIHVVALEEALKRDLITPEEFDYRRP